MPKTAKAHALPISHRNLREFFAYHGIWAPGVRMFRQLSFRSKAVLISACFLIPIAAEGLAYGHHAMQMLHSNAMAQIGVIYAKKVLALIQLLQAQRNAVLQPQNPVRTRGAMDLSKAISAQLNALKATDAQQGQLLHTTDHLQVLQANIDKASRTEAQNPLAIHKRHSQSVEAALALLDAALDGSGLTRDPNVGTSRLTHTGLAWMPKLLEATLAANDIGLAVSRGGNPQTGAKMISNWRSIAAYLDGQTRIGLDKVLAEHPHLSARLAYASTQEAMSRSDDLVNEVGSDGWTGDPVALAMSWQTVMKRSASLQSAIVDELERRQQSIIDRIRLECGFLLLLLSAALVLAAYMFISFSRVMQGGLNEVRRYLKAMTEGDLTTSPTPWGKDEAARLMTDLRVMQDALRDIVLQVRSSSEGIMSTSMHIAVGFTDLSSRSDRTSSSLQRTSTAIEEVGSTVRLTADDAGKASILSKESADAAILGGQVIERMNITMRSISNASTKIGELIRVIDDIAFQTNILALNAAVEAARAGESGRGFAVVASEVRSLAHRSAESAKEIKLLVTDSIDKVNNGVSVVEAASTSMEGIVSAAQRVNLLMDSIARSTREQATGVTDIVDSVSAADAMTQQNTVLVDDTVKAVAELELKTKALVEKVSYFRLPSNMNWRTVIPP